ncbi:MAG: hypothetical protein IPG52_08455 [Rhodocyclaceae bacterium]|nr:hypothetical protein [Rhodocyclaceae bacterium]
MTTLAEPTARRRRLVAGFFWTFLATMAFLLLGILRASTDIAVDNSPSDAKSISIFDSNGFIDFDRSALTCLQFNTRPLGHGKDYRKYLLRIKPVSQ